MSDLDIRIGVTRASPDVRIGIDRDTKDIGLSVYKGGSYFPDYEGGYTFTPSRQAQVVPTERRVLLENIVINPIPQNYGLITYNGAIITVS